ncbi:sorting nexin-14-like isoform X1 [Lutzomyia longipalpis]|uniref:sorting nexin-14-like isoform X1 n=2 Tax=Lutzomyia longipalpis TaxID=7200 RepID=UPI0024833B6C|nr:sorting nexin-14-like isoform X1 [Lutzomyia longipalpis]
MSILYLTRLVVNFWLDSVTCLVSIGVVLFTAVCVTVSLTLGLFIIVLYICGAIAGAVLLSNRASVAKYIEFLGFRNYVTKETPECELCGGRRCERHRAHQWRPREPWRGWSVDEQLDKAVDRFYTRILTSFVESWFSLVSRNENFVQLLKENLREATCRLILKIRQIDAPVLITDKLLPCAFAHHETVAKMLADGVPVDKLSATFVHQELTVHPATLNRRAELEYLRGVARCLMPRLINTDQLDSKVLGTLLRELLTCWVFLPLLDAISDPNLINLLIIVATNPRHSPINFRDSQRVTFLEAFARRRDTPSPPPTTWSSCDDLLGDQTKLYSFMQFLKREGAVDVLRFHLDVDNLNRELLDPRVTTDPEKVSALQQQSEKLLTTYQTQMQKEFGGCSAKTLTEAHEAVKASLQGHWRRAFRRTPEYFRLVYGDKDVHALEMSHGHDHGNSTVSRLSKLKGVIRGAVDGAPLEATEIPTVWDAFSETQAAAPNPTIYSSMTQKLRKERGQNLDNFMVSFMQSIEQTTDVGEDVIELREENERQQRPNPPGRNLIYGDLFAVHKNAHLLHNSSLALPYTIKGPSQCLVYILTRILVVPTVIVKFILALIRLSRTTVDSLICRGLAKLLQVGLHEPRLAFLLTLLEEQIFDEKHTQVGEMELQQRRDLARMRIVRVARQLGSVVDTLQSPALNKHLIYCLFDTILAEMFPEMDHSARE